MHDYPLCQNGKWVDAASATLYLMDSGVVDGTAWLPDNQPSLDAEATDASRRTQPPGDVTVIGRGTAAWNQYLYVTQLLADALCVLASAPNELCHSVNNVFHWRFMFRHLCPGKNNNCDDCRCYNPAIELCRAELTSIRCNHCAGTKQYRWVCCPWCAQTRRSSQPTALPIR